MGRLVQRFLPFPRCLPNSCPVSPTVPLFCLEDNVDSFHTLNKYLAQDGPQGKLPWEWQGQAWLCVGPLLSRFQARGHMKSALRAGGRCQWPEKNWVLIHNFKDQAFFLVKTTSANSRGSIKVHRRHSEFLRIYGMGSII